MVEVLSICIAVYCNIANIIRASCISICVLLQHFAQRIRSSYNTNLSTVQLVAPTTITRWSQPPPPGSPNHHTRWTFGTTRWASNSSHQDWTRIRLRSLSTYKLITLKNAYPSGLLMRYDLGRLGGAGFVPLDVAVRLFGRLLQVVYEALTRIRRRHSACHHFDRALLP